MQRASYRTFNFGIPAFRSRDGFVTCPSAGICAKGCYAQSGTFNFGRVKNAYHARLDAIKRKDFVSRMTLELQLHKPKAMRWNDSGDFYSMVYLKKAFSVAKKTPQVIHYAYTKQIELVKSVKWPDNFIFIYSYGGKLDHLINPKVDRHCKVFGDSEELVNAGYIEASFDDSIAWNHTNKRIGLIYHGAQSRKWTTTTNLGDPKWEKSDYGKISMQHCS